MELFTGLDPKITRRESNVKFPAVILIYLMRIVGFNGRERRDGTCARGQKKSSPNTDDNDNEPDCAPILIEADNQLRSGALSAQTLLPPIALERLFNGGLSYLPSPSFPKRSMPFWMSRKYNLLNYVKAAA